MPRNQRIALVYALLRKAGIREGKVDQTIMAEFVEVATGGNMNYKRIADTYSYKERGAVLSPCYKERFKAVLDSD